MSAAPGPRLLLIRHGQTEANVRRALDSVPPGPPLTEAGRRQTEELAASLAGEPIVAVYASTALRAQQTAAPIAAAHGLDVEVVDGVQEVFLGDLEGRTDHDALRVFFEAFSAWVAGKLDVRIPGGESGREVLERYGKVVADIRERHAEGVVVLLSHGGAIRLVAPVLAANLDFAATEPALVPNTGRVVLDPDPVGPTGWRCVEWTGIQLPG